MAAKVMTHKPKRGPKRIRGLMPSEYQIVSRMVRAGETTWEELERKGVVLPTGKESDFRRHVKKQLGKAETQNEA